VTPLKFNSIISLRALSCRLNSSILTLLG